MVQFLGGRQASLGSRASHCAVGPITSRFLAGHHSLKLTGGSHPLALSSPLYIYIQIPVCQYSLCQTKKKEKKTPPLFAVRFFSLRSALPELRGKEASGRFCGMTTSSWGGGGGGGAVRLWCCGFLLMLLSGGGGAAAQRPPAYKTLSGKLCCLLPRLPRRRAGRGREGGGSAFGPFLLFVLFPFSPGHSTTLV